MGDPWFPRACLWEPGTKNPHHTELNYPRLEGEGFKTRVDLKFLPPMVMGESQAACRQAGGRWIMKPSSPSSHPHPNLPPSRGKEAQGLAPYRKKNLASRQEVSTISDRNTAIYFDRR
jgi:hypothetical protein